MKSFVLAAAIALAGSSMIADDAAARSKRGAGAGMEGLAVMAPLALSAGAALIGSSGYVADPVLTPYVHVPTYVEPVVVPHVHVPVHTPIYVPMPFSAPSSSVNYGG